MSRNRTIDKVLNEHIIKDKDITTYEIILKQLIKMSSNDKLPMNDRLRATELLHKYINENNEPEEENENILNNNNINIV